MVKDLKQLNIGNRDMLHNKVCLVLRKAILNGSFKPGDRLIQTELAEIIGVSRMPIREALRTLEMEGLVTIEPHKGAVVRKYTSDDIREIFELRSILEPLALKKSMKRFTDKDIEKLKSYHHSMKQTTCEDTYVEFNAKFHKHLFSRSQSPRLIDFIEKISLGIVRDTPLIIEGQMKISNQEHEKILQAILINSPEEAAEHLAEHISRAGEELIIALTNKQSAYFKKPQM
ncbi:GntR family transcriptional regulator [Bacillaceae bacterium W0354]